MIRQMPFKLPLILSVVAAVLNNDEAQAAGAEAPKGSLA